MRRPRVRFTVRRLMAVVAIVAVTIGGYRLRERRERSLILRSRHEIQARGCLSRAEALASLASQNEGQARQLRDTARTRNDERFDEFALACETQAAVERSAEQRERALARYHEALRIKYTRAARLPWLAVSLDPPPPE